MRFPSSTKLAPISLPPREQTRLAPRCGPTSQGGSCTFLWYDLTVSFQLYLRAKLSRSKEVQSSVKWQVTTVVLLLISPSSLPAAFLQILISLRAVSIIVVHWGEWLMLIQIFIYWFVRRNRDLIIAFSSRRTGEARVCWPAAAADDDCVLIAIISTK